MAKRPDVNDRHTRLAPVLAVLIAVAIAVPVARTAAPLDLQHAALAGGGEVSLRREAALVTVTINGPRTGLASLCLADGSVVRIFHASAAIGEAVYERSADRWRLKSEFEWQLRDTPGVPGASQRDVNALLTRNGWVANASAGGSPRRTFRIHLGSGQQYLGVTYLSTDSMAISYWPDGIAHDCRLVSIAQGHLPETATFRPESWHPITRPDDQRNGGAAPQRSERPAITPPAREHH